MTSPISPLAGKPAPQSSLMDVAKLVTAYYEIEPGPTVAAQRVVFGTSGHRGSAFDGSFNEPHVLAITQAIGGNPAEDRIQVTATAKQQQPAALSSREVTATELAGEKIDSVIDRAPGMRRSAVSASARPRRVFTIRSGCSGFSRGPRAPSIRSSRAHEHDLNDPRQPRFARS